MRVISLFSGAGGMDLGLIQAGHQIVWANDIDEDCVMSYKKNISPNIVHADISEINLNLIPDADIVVGGFPCQGFSQANLKRSKDDKRNKLYLYFLKVIQQKQPKYFLAENVRGLLSIDGGKAIKRIINDFSSAGYRVKHKLFNLADYGVPQTRNRVIIAGIRKDLPWEADFQFPIPTHSKKGEKEGLLPWITISEALRDISEPENEKNSLPNNVFSKYKVTNRNFTGHRKTDPSKPSPTILARGNGKGGVCAIQHPKNHRRMSIRESATVQTFPLEFEFYGSMNSCYRQVGNAVPVLFARRLGEQLKILERKVTACA
ncbi:MAG: DNA cytosine methyltransferase [Candidatus ainarchaeum sp.]|nr:DNA cytosine methyltransferase [Candidatus ainarchaeum sp.]